MRASDGLGVYGEQVAERHLVAAGFDRERAVCVVHRVGHQLRHRDGDRLNRPRHQHNLRRARTVSI